MPALLRQRVRGIRRALFVVLAISAVAPSSSLAFSKAIWGDVYRHGVNQFPLYKQLGVTLYQTELRWDQVAPTRPTNAFDSNDAAYRWPADVEQVASAQTGADWREAQSRSAGRSTQLCAGSRRSVWSTETRESAQPGDWRKHLHGRRDRHAAMGPKSAAPQRAASTDGLIRS